MHCLEDSMVQIRFIQDLDPSRVLIRRSALLVRIRDPFG